jgi:hypothetical protein
MPNLTRKAAIEAALRDYEALVARARSMAPEEADFVDALSELWQARLEGLGRVRANPPLSDDTQAAFAYLGRQLAAATEVDQIVGWIDAYPDAITQMLPPSALTFRVEHGGAAAGPVSGPMAREQMVVNAA